MENLILFLILFVIFFIVFLVDYFIKRKKKKLKKFIGMELVKAKKEDYNKLGIILSIVNAFIISSTGVLCTMIDMDKMAIIIRICFISSTYLCFLWNYRKYIRKYL